MSLPSGICAAFKDYVTDRTVTVCYNSNFESGPFKDLIAEEISRITDKRLGMKTQALDVLYLETTWKYILVLVNNKHWIAVKHVKEDKFVCYDPDEGKDSDGSTMGEAIENLRKNMKSVACTSVSKKQFNRNSTMAVIIATKPPL